MKPRMNADKEPLLIVRLSAGQTPDADAAGPHHGEGFFETAGFSSHQMRILLASSARRAAGKRM